MTSGGARSERVSRVCLDPNLLQLLFTQTLISISDFMSERVFEGDLENEGFREGDLGYRGFKDGGASREWKVWLAAAVVVISHLFGLKNSLVIFLGFFGVDSVTDRYPLVAGKLL